MNYCQNVDVQRSVGIASAFCLYLRPNDQPTLYSRLSPCWT